MMIILLEVKQGKWKLTTLNQVYMDSKEVKKSFVLRQEQLL